MLGESTALRSFLGQLERAASSDEPVLLLGETGSGKELAARRLHEVGPRCGSPFVAVNVASIPSELFESELYGHRKGSFTGADRDRVGLFAEAAEGTLFIDEVGDLPLDAQVKLLRTLEGRCFRPVGANHEQPFAGRVVAATHQDLPRLVEAGRFRKDLYYRLSVIPLALPPLRSRGEDILVIADAWLERLQGEHRRLRLSDDAKARLRGYSFPGNVRELVNLMKRAAIFTRSDEIDAALLEELLCSSPFQARSAESGGLSAGQRVTVESLERAHITRLLEELNNVSEVARVAGIDRRTLQRKMIAWGLRHDGE
jgi:DNA-binding NtrC family response regulator